MEIIKEILNDLYKIDSSLKKYESELIKTIKIMLDSKPNTEIDEQFKEDLRMHLFQKIEQLKYKKHNSMKKENTLKYYLPKFAYAFSGALLLGLILFPIMLQLGKTSAPVEDNFEKSVIEKSKEAFGPLFSEQEQLGLRDNRLSEDSPLPVPRYDSLGVQEISIGGYPSTVRPSSPYEFVYRGDTFDLEESEVKVFKRVTDSKSSVLNSFVNNLDLGLIDLNNFSDLEVNNVNLVQKADNGYNLYINFDNGNISIHKRSRNYLSERKMLTLENQLSDEEVIGISDSFLDTFGIDTSSFGSPVVEHSGPEYHIMDEKKIISEYVNVLYPLILDGKTVYSQSGGEYGLSVTVNIREREVSSVYNLFVQKYETSMYKAITNTEKIIEWAERGSFYGHYVEENGEAKEIGLKTPTVGYMRFMNYGDGKSNELYTPALIFPIEEIPEDVYLSKKNVVVPLAEDLLKDSVYPKPMPEPMPMPEKLDEE